MLDDVSWHASEACRAVDRVVRELESVSLSDERCNELAEECLMLLHAVSNTHLGLYALRLSRIWWQRPWCGALGDAVAMSVLGVRQRKELEETCRWWPLAEGDDEVVANALSSLLGGVLPDAPPPRGPLAFEAWCHIALEAAQAEPETVRRWASFVRNVRPSSEASHNVVALASLLVVQSSSHIGLFGPLLSEDFWAYNFEAQAKLWRGQWHLDSAPTIDEVAAVVKGASPSLTALSELSDDHDTLRVALAVMEDVRPPQRGIDFVVAWCSGDGAGCDMSSALVQSSTLIVLGADTRFRVCARIRSAVQAILGISCSVNLYCTPPGAQGLDVHFDDHDVFVVQLRGTKQWRLYDDPHGVVPAYPRLLCRRFDAPTEMLRRNVATAWLLQPGDILYIPRGIFHAATAGYDASRHSIHVTIGLDLDPVFTHEGTVHALLFMNYRAPLSVHAAVKLVAINRIDILRRASLGAILDRPAPDNNDFWHSLAPQIAAALDDISTPTPVNVSEFRWWFDNGHSNDNEKNVTVGPHDAALAASHLRAFFSLDDEQRTAIDNLVAPLLAWQRDLAQKKLQRTTQLAEFYLRLQGR